MMNYELTRCADTSHILSVIDRLGVHCMIKAHGRKVIVQPQTNLASLQVSSIIRNRKI